MLSSFWDAVGGKLADRWAAVAGSTVVFWTGGVLAWAFAGSGWARLTDVTDWLDRQKTAGQIAVLLGALVLVGASAVVVQRLSTPVLRLLEGYWPRWMNRPRRTLVEDAQQRAQKDNDAWQSLKAQIESPAVPTPEQLLELAELERRIHHRPSTPNRLLPTRVGNILRTAETRPADKYGLEAVIVWSRLWLVLPEATRQELSTARTSLDGSVAAVVWGVLFCGFTPLAWWALPLGLAVAVGAVLWWVPTRAEVFADLVEATYDLHRIALYRQLRWPLPANPHLEHTSGEQVTKYLVRGSDLSDPEFTLPP
jgi:hypothetical protein